MNAQNEIRNDLEKFGARITRFGVVVEKIWNFEVSGLNWDLQNFWWTRNIICGNLRGF
jgi:hypothetical protein